MNKTAQRWTFWRTAADGRDRSASWLVVWAVFLLTFTVPAVGFSSQAEILTPRPGSTVIARQPETHLVLRQAVNAPLVRVQLGDSMVWLDPVISEEGEDGLYQHYRLPLQPGPNSFRLQPGGEPLSLDYQQVQSELHLRPRGKDVHSFHEGGQLPAACRDCHDLTSSSVSAPLGLNRQDACLTCHDNQVGQERWQHSTTLNRQCLACHQQSGSDGQIGMPETAIRTLCLGCHTGKRDLLEKKFVHGPINLGSCTLCHGPHGGDYRHQLWADKEADLCVACHGNMAQLVADIRAQKIPYVHGVLTGPGCVACHDPHASDQIFVLKKPINELCSGCHPGPARADSHPVPGHPVEAPKEQLRPDRALSCTSCHEPHASYNRYMLIEPVLGGRLCLECHRNR